MIRALLVTFLLASLFSHADTWPANLYALWACSLLAYAIGRVQRGEQPVQMATVSLPRAVGIATSWRRDNPRQWPQCKEN